MPHPFFADSTFAWIYFSILMIFLGLASYFDFRYLLIPKKVTISCFFCGIACSVLRGAFLANQGQAVWMFSEPSLILGVLDALLFSLAGFLVGFAMFTAMFVLGICGGGDVKLYSALGVWLGPLHVLYVMLGASIILIVVSYSWFILVSLGYGFGYSHKIFSHEQAQKTMKKGKPLKGRLMSYSFPTALAVLVIMGWLWGVELQMRAPGKPRPVGTESGKNP